MHKIFKYPLELIDEQVVQLPKDSWVLSIVEQHDKPVLYAMVDPEKTETTPVRVYIVGTGRPVPFEPRAGHTVNDYTYMGTLNTKGGELMWHTFVHVPKPAAPTAWRFL